MPLDLEMGKVFGAAVPISRENWSWGMASVVTCDWEDAPDSGKLDATCLFAQATRPFLLPTSDRSDNYQMHYYGFCEFRLEDRKAAWSLHSVVRKHSSAMSGIRCV